MITRRNILASGLSIAAAGAVGYGLWPKLDGYRQELESQRQLLSSDPTLRELVRMSTLAANGHNTQPWKFRIDPNKVSILPDFTRRTEIVDPDDHHLYVSLGCAAENLAIAASAHGQPTDVIIEPNSEPQINMELGNGPIGNEALYRAIPMRQSTRAAFDGQSVSSADLELLRTAAKQDGVTVLFFTDQSDREAITEFVVEGNSAQMDDPAFVSELRDWLRFNPDKAIELRDGLFSACSGNPVVPEWIGERLFKAFLPRTLRTQNTETICSLLPALRFSSEARLTPYTG